jgi:outer membrane protein assembly factor BamD (BamD/ComL family)
LAESHGRAGHLQEARTFAKRYLERYPTHPRAEKVKRWLEAR